MATPYSEIFNLFLAGIQDYKIDKLYQMSVEDAETYMTSFLVRALVNFKNCQKNLEDRDDTNKQFNETLSTEEKVILANLMIVEWLTKEVNDIMQMRLHLHDADFRTYSEAENLREKRQQLIVMRELVEKQMVKYGYKNFDWSKLKQ